MSTEELREHYLMPGLMEEGKIHLVYLHYDRMIAGGAVPLQSPIELPADEALRSAYFLERRELGIVNIGGDGSVIADGQEYSLRKLDCLYLSRGQRSVSLLSADPQKPARFFLLSTPAHAAFESKLMRSDEAMPAQMGSQATSNERTIYKYIHEEGIRSCQLVMGLTVLKEGNVWNTMPAHTHHRRSEVYCYFDVKEGHRVVHLMGAPQQTRHLLLGNEEAIVSPPWSIHSGCGTASYSFIWGMGGENQSFSDMDAVSIESLR